LDKYEYKVHADEIRRLVAEGDFAAAMEICDIIDWNRVKSVMMLCTVSDIYKINRRYEDSKNILLLAYDRHPGGRQIVYSLCELSIKLEEYVQAIEYYKEFVRIAPKDTGKFILLYRLYEAQDAGLEDRIDVLKKLKAREYKEKWAYELAYLYHRNGNVTDCIEECDELVLWFGEGKYVKKALELKMLHAALTPEQQAKYSLLSGQPVQTETATETKSFTRVMEHPADIVQQEAAKQQSVLDAPTTEMPGKEIDIHVKTMDVGQYSTLNLQKALAESMREALNAETVTEEQKQEDERRFSTKDLQLFPAGEKYSHEGEKYSHAGEKLSPAEEQFSTKNLQLFPDGEKYSHNEEKPSPAEEQQPAPTADTKKTVQEAFDHTDPDLTQVEAIDLDTRDFLERQTEPDTEEVFFEDRTGSIPPAVELLAEEEKGPALSDAARVMQQMKRDWTGQDETPATQSTGAVSSGPRVVMPEKSGFDHILSQEYDGQISLVVPETEKVTKQITGQMSIADIMAEWEVMKKENEQKRAEDVRRRVLEQTGNMFKDFEISSKNGLFAELDGTADEPEANEAEPEPEKVESSIEDLSVEESPLEESPIKETDMAQSGEVTDGQADIADTEPGEEEPEDQKEPETETKTEEREQKSGPPVKAEEPELRPLTEEEKSLFGQFIQNKSSRRQIVQALDAMSLAAYTGNVIVTGDEGTGTMTLAKNLIREIQLTDRNFSGRVAKIKAAALNKKDVAETLAKLNNGALIIQGAGNLNSDTVQALCKTLDNENSGIIVVLEGTRRSMDRMLAENEEVSGYFNARVDVEALPNDELVSFGKKYAHQMEYSIDDMGTLALHTRISDMQTADHAVTIYEVRDIIDEAIVEADRKSPKHFFDILFGKRYDEEDMIVLREDDFMKNIG